MTTPRHTVLITGSSSGFGRAAVSAFAQRGWNVVATARTVTDDLTRLVGPDLLVLPLDVRDATSVHIALARATETFGGVDCVVNNAGVGLFSALEATPMTAIRATFETNVFGMIQVLQAVIPHFRSRGGGRIVNLSSGAAIVPEPLMAAYTASKFAVEGLSESLRYELAAHDIVVKLVEPGLVTGTNFMHRAADASAAVPVPEAYRDLAQQMSAMLQGELSFEAATESTVAEAIVAAATDLDGPFRYLVGDDTRVSAHMRRETSDQEYDAWATARYPVPA